MAELRLATPEFDFKFDEDILLVNGERYEYCEMTDSVTQAELGRFTRLDDLSSPETNILTKGEISLQGAEPAEHAGHLQLEDKVEGD